LIRDDFLLIGNLAPTKLRIKRQANAGCERKESASPHSGNRYAHRG
jgi:hypothetical protein